MILFVLIQHVPPFLALLLAGMVYLAIVEVRDKHYMTLQEKIWWVLLVFLTNFIGLIALRIYTYVRGRRQQA